VLGLPGRGKEYWPRPEVRPGREIVLDLLRGDGPSSGIIYAALADTTAIATDMRQDRVRLY
jgi:hypothetical protein